MDQYTLYYLLLQQANMSVYVFKKYINVIKNYSSITFPFLAIK